MYRYSLVNKDKITCPSCGRKKKLSRYFDNQEQVFASEEYGRCDREISCGYHNYPKNNTPIKAVKVDKKPVVHNVVPYQLVLKSLKHQGKDKLSQYLISVFGEENVKKTLAKYKVGFSTKFDGDSTVFWQIANDGARSGKIMQYTSNGKRKKKNGYSFTTWVHAEVYKKFELKQVLFGGQLKCRNKTVVIVESEKTAIICDIFFNNPKYVFMACGQLRGLQRYKFDELKGYKEIVFMSDTGKAKAIWEEESKKLGFGRVSNSLDSLGLKEGDDIADAILMKKISDKIWISKI